MSVNYKPIDYELAKRAHYGTSFSPERRGRQEVADHKQVFEDLQKDLGDFFEQKHADKLRDLWTAYLHSHSAVMSSMITGPARFPVERNRKRSEWADNKLRELFDYCDNLRKWKGKDDRREAVAAAGGELAVAKAKLAKSQAWHATMKDANKIIRSKPKGEITEEKINALMELGLENKVISDITRGDEWYGFGFQSFQLTNSNARIKNQAARVAELERREQAKKTDVEAEMVEIPGGVITYDVAANRINVKHDEKPDREIIQIIKKHGFKWSRNYGHWTRIITQNARFSTGLLIKELNKQAGGDV